MKGVRQVIDKFREDKYMWSLPLPFDRFAGHRSQFCCGFSSFRFSELGISCYNCRLYRWICRAANPIQSVLISSPGVRDFVKFFQKKFVAIMKWEIGSASPGPGSGWSLEQNKLFENALAIFDKDTTDRWESIATLVPGKSPGEVRKHYEDLVEDVSVIEAGRIALPSYAQSSYTPDWVSDESPDVGSSKQHCGVRGSGSSVKPSEQERKKGVPWTEDEHRQFLRGLKEYGKGDWRSISRNFVISRTPTQVASHAQKYFLRLNSGQKEKKRSSIHDITTVGGDEFRQTSLQQASVITNSSATTAIAQSPGLMYSSSMGGAAMVNSLGCPTGDNPLMLPSHSLGPYAQTGLGGFPARPIISGSSLTMAQMGYPMQPTMHQ